ncbi:MULTISPECIES: superoxide dismutase family protein [Streptomyces]|uniref:Superoxide dismutase family protein n=1 Tax=Streptomyces caniscabiei TaxID=2746961 RepID=A0ABU4MRQ2_9ACTN|nr:MULTISPECIES: superoxide dismutase family protein [Streptomyces]MBE4738180.1 superoxide dismutase family protein [Streptomyces caniscabiei]MBE4756942.1 superoxide dismutase family protein [Streptomyces caniscabiei]MBE4773882.1 superoxide dismutase family protein [Streptomyces caniscabiei]MBE4785548.1 superoxide dismutase family protein [Streptomyces caniscabiei]MBE4796890.1 superoxide dismutase family protein [Streptomyces caniscabiei]
MARHKLTLKHKRFIAAGAAVAAIAGGLGVAANAGASETVEKTTAEKTTVEKKAPVAKVVVKTVFAPAATADVAPAVTYDTALVPVAGRVQVKEELRRDGGTRIELRLRDLAANRAYGAHVHTKPCGELPADAGPHYQDELDPKQPSVDPAYANPENEVWLDVRTNEDGSARSIAAVDWRFRDGGARSVVLHTAATSTHAGHAGTAGARLACVNVPFE